jgi:phospholipid-binding lipoprotein MlaA
MVAALAVQAVDPLPVAPVPVAPSPVVADEQRVPVSPVVPVSPPVVPVAPVAAPQTAPVPAPVPAEPNAQKDIVVVGQSRDAGDPLRGVNAQAFGATQAVDSAVVGPVARVYKRKVPSPIRKGIHNFL